MSAQTRAAVAVDAGHAMHDLAARLYPIGRSLTGDGVRATLRLIGHELPIEIHEVPTGTRVFDWTVPKEWNVRDAYVKNAAGERVIDYRASNLHLVGYSVPVHRRMSLAQLRPHLHTLEDHPDWIPYRTSYFKETWGFCLAHRRLLELTDGEYEVCIDSSLEDGYLTYGEAWLPGQVESEFLVSCHVCHPSLCNDNLSGIVTAVHLARAIAARPRRFSYRFLFVPGMIGPITWLARNEARLYRIAHGLVLACVGDPGRPTYKRSRHGSAEIDRAVVHVLRSSGRDHEVLDFTPVGYDERQYGSPGIDLPVGCLMRTPHGRYPEYHTSADDLTLIRAGALADTLTTLLAIVDVIEGNGRYVNQSPMGEPQLGRRGLYGHLGGEHRGPDETAMLWVLSFCDGMNSLLDIADRAALPFHVVRHAADALQAAGLLVETRGHV